LACFEEEGELIRPLLITRWQDPSVQFYIATFGEESVGCKEPVGTLRVYDWEETFGIYGFVVISSYRGRGYGRQMLEELIPMLRAQSNKPIMLEVDVTNAHALGLYQSCGFQIKTTYGYYEVTL
jgi:ribosomal protein S18 acetylase RimI-like enzyme